MARFRFALRALTALATVISVLGGRADAAPIYNVTGTYDFRPNQSSGGDFLGMDGESFDYTVEPSHTPVTFNDLGTNDLTVFAIGDRMLRLTGTTANGLYSLTSPRQNSAVRDNYSTGDDLLSLGGSRFVLSRDFQVEVDFINVRFIGNTIVSGTDGTPDIPPTFTPDQIQGVSLATNLRVTVTDLNSQLTARYNINDLTMAVTAIVPEPTSGLLLLLGTAATAAVYSRNRRRRLSRI